MREFLTTIERLLQGNLDLIILWLISLFFVGVLVYSFLELRSPKSYYIAIIGLPQSGKTTIIHAMFREILDGRIKGMQANLWGRSTTERVMRGISSLEEGKALLPTQEKDIFGYRTSMLLGTVLKKKYDVTIGDFPGRQSEILSGRDSTENADERYLEPEFARWVNEADAFIFVVDLARCYAGFDPVKREINKEYVRKTTSAIRTAWQNVLHEHAAGEKVKISRVVLVFTKADLVNYIVKPDANVATQVERFGYKDLPWGVRIDPVGLKEQADNILREFAEVRKFFLQSGNRYNEVFTSSVGVLNNTRLVTDESISREPRLGIEELLRSILPAPPSG